MSIPFSIVFIANMHCVTSSNCIQLTRIFHLINYRRGEARAVSKVFLLCMYYAYFALVIFILNCLRMQILHHITINGIGGKTQSQVFAVFGVRY